MTEAAKTSIFVGIGLLTAVLAFVASWQPAEAPLGSEKAFAKIENAGDVASMQIVKFNEATGKVDQFMVEYADSHYVIPSHDGYPADAEEQLLNAAGSVMSIDILHAEENERALHDDRGLVDPLDASIGRETEAATVGTRVTMTDGEGKKLADFIIGHETETGENVRFARRAGQDRIYTIELDTSHLSTNFEDWIEKDLLKLDPLDVRGVYLEDYSVIRERNPFGFERATGVDQRASVKLAYNAQDLKWELEGLLSFDQVEGQPVMMQLADDQELDDTKLNGLKNALDDLKIVDVRKKPGGLVNEENLEEADPAALRDLPTRGFFYNPTTRKIVSDQGEVQIIMANGVRYILRFGQIAGSAEKADEGEKGGTGEQDIHRYLWVSAEENLGIFPQPDLKPVPELPEVSSEVEKVEEGADDEAAVAAANEKKKELDRLKAERETVLRNNDRKKSEYMAKVTAAKEAVAKLNRSFDDWYYVIADDTYKQIHLGRDDIIKMKEAPAEDAVHGAAIGGPASGQLPLGAGFDEEAIRAAIQQQLQQRQQQPTEAAPVETTPVETTPAEETEAVEEAETEESPTEEEVAPEETTPATPAAPAE